MRKLNVLLVIPRYETYDANGHYVMPLGILYISSYLKESNVAKVFTLNINHIKGEERQILTDYIKANDVDILGIGGLSGEYVDMARMVVYAKQIKPEIKIILGGGIMTADPIVTMTAIPQVDYGIIGEGEKTIVELVQALSGERLIEDISGIIYYQNGKLKQTRKRGEIKDLDSLPFPDYEGFNYQSYLEENPDMSDLGKKYSQVSIVGGRSCKYNCTFCFHPSGTTYRQRTLDSIFSEIDYLISHYEISYIALREELFATDNRRVAEFCERIGKYDLDWSIQLRIDGINQELVDILKVTRCRYVFVGVESANDDILQSMRKGITVAEIETALDMLHEVGLNSRSGVIFGDQCETEYTAMWTFNWYLKNKARYRMFVDMIIAFPGSTIYKNGCKANLIDPVHFLQDGCPIVNISKMSKSEFDKILALVEQENGRRYYVKEYINK